MPDAEIDVTRIHQKIALKRYQSNQISRSRMIKDLRGSGRKCNVRKTIPI
jgi:hypothetical protein